MGNSSLYENDAERKKHHAVIENLANRFGISEEAIEAFYERELERLKREAKVKDFLSVIVSKRIRGKLLRHEPLL